MPSSKPARDIEAAAIVQQVARIHRVQKRYVRMVTSAERHSPAILSTYMYLQEARDAAYRAAVELAKEQYRQRRKSTHNASN